MHTAPKDDIGTYVDAALNATCNGAGICIEASHNGTGMRIDVIQYDIGMHVDVAYLMLKTATNMHTYARLITHATYTSSVDSNYTYADIVKNMHVHHNYGSQ